MFVTVPSIFHDPFHMADSFDSEFETLLPSSFSAIERPTGFPYVNVAEYKDEIQVVAELPGIPKDAIKLQLADGVLTISGERKAPETAKDAQALRREIWYGSFSRSIEVPEEVETDKISAEYQDGILRVVLPKAEAAKPKDIAIR